MLHGEYEQLRKALQIGLQAAGLERNTEIEGPNRLGGFRLSDGEHRVALSFASSRKKEDREAGRHWWVSAWVPVTDGYEKLLSSDLIPIPHQREVLMRKPLDIPDAVVAVVQMLGELRVRAALSRSADMVSLPAESAETMVIPPMSAPPAISPALTDTVFGTAPNRASDRDVTRR